MAMLDSLLSQLGGGGIGQLASLLGEDVGATGNAVQAALPAMLSSLAQNAQQPGGADALLGALGKHDGSLLDNLTGALGGDGIDTDDGSKIVGHMFGGNQESVAQNIAGASGLNIGSVMKLLPVLAPLLMGLLGRHQRANNADAGGLSSLLQDEAGSGGDTSTRDGAGGMLGGLTGMLDKNKDGSVVDDLVGMATGGGSGGARSGAGGVGGMLSKILGGLFKKR